MIRRSTTSVTPGADNAVSIASRKHSEFDAFTQRAAPNRPSRLQLRTLVRTAEPRGGSLHYSPKLPRLARSPEALGKVIEVGDDLWVGLEPVGPGLLSAGLYRGGTRAMSWCTCGMLSTPSPSRGFRRLTVTSWPAAAFWLKAFDLTANLRTRDSTLRHSRTVFGLSRALRRSASQTSTVA